MKITIVLPHLNVSGGVRVAAIYAKKFIESGHDVTLISPARPTVSRKRKLLQRLQSIQTQTEPKVDDTTMISSLLDAHILLSKPFPIEPAGIPDADVIIATWWETAFAVSELPPEKGKKFYFVQHHEVHKHLRHHLSHGSYYLPLKKVVIAQWLQDVMAQRYGDHDTVVIHNSVDTEQFYAPERERQTVPTVGLLYATNPFKGLDISLAAIERARKVVPNLKVVAYSTRPLNSNFSLPPGSEFHINPPQDRLRDIYASCDVWLCGSRTEGFHLPPSEAMACRCPVVSTRVGGAIEIIEEGVNGHLVDVEDAETLGDRLVEVLKAPHDRWKAMSNAAFRQVQNYSWDDAARKFLDVLEAEYAKLTPKHSDAMV